MKKHIITTLLLAGLLQVSSCMGMSEEEQDLQAAIRLSEESLKKAQESILLPGMYKQYVEVTELVSEPMLPSNTPSSSSQTLYLAQKPVMGKMYKIYQIAVKDPQSLENVSCGPRDLFFADAIDKLHAAGRPIASNTLHKILSSNQRYQKAIEQCNRQLYSDEFNDFIETKGLNITQYYVLARNIAQSGIYYIRSYVPAMDPEQLTNELAILGKNLKENKISYPIHFICNDASKKHWVLISVIKKPNTNAVIYYIDSKNINLDKYPVAHNFIGYIVDNLGLPSETEKQNVDIATHLDTTSTPSKIKKNIASRKTHQKRYHRISIK